MRCATVVLIAGCHFHAGKAAVIADADDDDDAAIDAVPDAPADAMPDTPPPPIAFVQAVAPGYITNTTVTVPITVTTGDLIVAATYTSLLGMPGTVSDDTALTWTALTAREASGSCAPRLQLWYAFATASHAINVKLTFPTSSAMGMHVFEYSGVLAAPVLAEAGQSATSSTNVAATGNVVTPAFGAVVAFFADLNGTGTMTIAPPWTSRAVDTGFYTLVADNAPGAAEGTFAPTATLAATDACWTAAAVALR